MSNFSTPAEIVDLTIESGKIKTSRSVSKMFLFSILAGSFIAFGAEASSVAMHAVDNVGLARLIAGCVFPVGLIMIVVLGQELFTGNCLIVMSVMSKQVKVSRWIVNLVVLYIGNLIGSLIIVFLVYMSSQWGYSGDALGAVTIRIAMTKIELGFWQAFSSAILCNTLVCVAVLIATAAKDIVGKIVGIFFPISAFVISGFEHSIANMYYIPAGMLAATNTDYANKAMELYGYTSERIASLNLVGFGSNILPVTLGNIVGGVMLGVIIYCCFKKNK